MVNDSSAQSGGSAGASGTPPGNNNHKNRKILVGVIIVGAALGIGLAIEQGENGNSPSLSPFRP
jgi:hypothetical protein